MEIILILIFASLMLSSFNNSRKNRVREQVKMWIAQTNAILGWEKYELRKKHLWSLEKDAIWEWDDSCQPSA